MSAAWFYVWGIAASNYISWSTNYLWTRFFRFTHFDLTHAVPAYVKYVRTSVQYGGVVSCSVQWQA